MFVAAGEGVRELHLLVRERLARLVVEGAEAAPEGVVRHARHDVGGLEGGVFGNKAKESN